MFGAFLAWYGTRVSGNEAIVWRDQLLKKSDELGAKSDQLAAKSDELAAKNNELVAKSDENAAKSDEIAKISQENARLSQELVAYATGGNSFLYVHVKDFGTATREIQVRTVGKYPVRDTSIVVVDISEQFKAAPLGAEFEFDVNGPRKAETFVNVAYPIHRDKVLSNYFFEENPSRASYAYFIYFTNASGRFRQLIHMAKSNGEWKQAYFVERLTAEGKATLEVEYFDPGYRGDGRALTRRLKKSELKQ
jgi:hypothetical protein